MEDFTGSVFGSYKLLEMVGSGGFANVYRAVHIWLGTPAAVKVLNIYVNPRDKEAVRRSLQEALIANHLRHRNIIPILDCNIQHGIPYIVMPYIKNGSLRQVHGQHVRLPWDTIIDYIGQVTAALTLMHSHKLIHQDVKPENMLLDDNGNILLSDFATVAFIEHTGPHYSHVPVGTVSYMAPERFTEGIQTPASDVYSLGIVVYEWLIGRPPFSGTHSEIAYKHLYAPVPTRHMKAMGIEPAIQRVLLKALAKNPLDRYQSALELYEALKNASSVGNYSKRKRLRRWLCKNRQSVKWTEMPIIFVTSLFISPLLSVGCYLLGVSIGTDVLIWQISLGIFSHFGSLIRKNWLAFGFSFTSLTVAIIIGFLAHLWLVFCFIFPGLLLISALIGLLKGQQA